MEQSICDAYKVSRTPVREALLQLEMEGLVEIVPNRGAFVLGISPELEDMFTLRKIYETQAVMVGNIERITDEETAQLEETFDFMEFYTMKIFLDKMLNINVNFHYRRRQTSHNRMLQNLLASYQAYIHYGSQQYGEAKEDYLVAVLLSTGLFFRPLFIEMLKPASGQWKFIWIIPKPDTAI